MDFKTLMKDHGWKLVKVCGCGGTTTYKYRRNEYEIHVKPNRSNFTIFLNERVQLTDKLLNLPNHVE